MLKMYMKNLFFSHKKIYPEFWIYIFLVLFF